MKAKSQQITMCWSRAKALHEAQKAHGRRFLVNRILLGKELASLKKKLGFSHGSQSRFSPSPQIADLGGNSRTWEGWCLMELGISEDTSRRWIKCFEAAIQRAKSPNTKAKFPKAAHLLQMPAAEMDGSEIDELAACVERLLDHQMITTQQDLLEDMGVKKQKLDSPKNKDGAAPNPEKDPLTVLTPDYFAEIYKKLQGVSKEILRTREYTNYKSILHELPITTDQKGELSLQSIKGNLEIILESHEELLTKDLPKMISDVEEAISRKMQGTAPKKARKPKAIAAR